MSIFLSRTFTPKPVANVCLAIVCLATFLILATVCDSAFSQNVLKDQQLNRRPESLAFSADETFVLIGNRESGTVSVVKNSAAPRVVVEHKIGKQISDLQRIDIADEKGSFFLATDFDNHQLIGLELEPNGDQLKILWKLKTPRYPTKLIQHRCEDDGKATVAVLGLWSRQLGVFEIEGMKDPPQSAQAFIDLEINPGLGVWLGDDRLMIASAFGERFAVVDPKATIVRTVVPFSGHRTGGMHLDHEKSELWLSQQRLSSIARSNRNDVHWGMMISNVVRKIELEELSGFIQLYDDAIDTELRSQKIAIGNAGKGSADPGALISFRGQMAVLIEGADEVATFSKLPRPRFISVGDRPRAVLHSETQDRLIVANSLSDSISFVNPRTRQSSELELGPRSELTASQRGERLFFDASLAHDSWMSCNSCHVDGHTNGLLNDNQSDGSYGTPKRVLSLRGHGDTLPLAWNGSNETYADQLKKTISVTMQGDVALKRLSDADLDDLAAYVRSLPPPPSVASARGIAQQPKTAAQFKVGKRVFETLGCSDCHAGAKFTSERLVKIGVSDERGELELNPPSLIGVSQRNGLFHDNRASQLSDVFKLPGHSIEEKLTDAEMSALIAFLKSL